MARAVAARGVLIALTLWAVPAFAVAQLPPPEKLLPSGFTLENNHSNPPIVAFTAKSAPQEMHPTWGTLPAEIELGCNFMPMAMPDMMVQMAAQAPEDPESQVGATVTTPEGKEMWRDGVISFHKTTTPWIGEGEGPDHVVWDGAWMGAIDGGVLTIGVSNVLSGKDEVRSHVLAVLRNAGLVSGSE